MIEKYFVSGMMCAVCASHVEKAVKNLQGVRSANVELLNNFLFVDYDSKKIKSEDIMKAVSNAGYEAKIVNESFIESGNEKKTLKNA
jgi:copper chaperone CopZ